MDHKEQIHLIGCRNNYAFDHCDECGFRFGYKECECFRHKTNRMLVWYYFAFRDKNFLD